MWLVNLLKYGKLWIEYSTHIGVYNGIKPSNRYFEMPTVWLFDFKAGRVVYAKRLVDNHVFTRHVHMEN